MNKHYQTVVIVTFMLIAPLASAAQGFAPWAMREVNIIAAGIDSPAGTGGTGPYYRSLQAPPAPDGADSVQMPGGVMPWYRPGS